MIHLLTSIATPIMWVLALMVSGLIFVRRSRQKSLTKLGLFLVLLGTLVLFLLSTPLISNLLVYSLEHRHRPSSIEVMSTLDVMVILGGGILPSGGLRDHAEASGLTYSRVFNGVKIFQRSGTMMLALCGGGSKRTGEAGAEVMKNLAVQLGVSESRIITETRSHNTMENAAELAKLLPVEGKRHIGLVTSALHMSRSEKVFRKVFPQDTIVCIPVHYVYTPPECKVSSIVPSARALLRSTQAIHEWIGMLWYSIRY